MFVLYNTITQQVVPYPRYDNQPVENLDPNYIVLKIVQQDLIPIDPAIQNLVGTQTVDLDNFELVCGWEVVDKPRDPLYDIISPVEP